jgi:hypothetical protein
VPLNIDQERYPGYQNSAAIGTRNPLADPQVLRSDGGKVHLQAGRYLRTKRSATFLRRATQQGKFRAKTVRHFNLKVREDILQSDLIVFRVVTHITGLIEGKTLYEDSQTQTLRPGTFGRVRVLAFHSVVMLRPFCQFNTGPTRPR